MDVISALLGLSTSEGTVPGIAEGAAGFADVLQAALAGAGALGAGDATEVTAPSGSAREALAWLASALGLGSADTTSPTERGQPASVTWAALPEALRHRLTQLDALAGMWLASVVARIASVEAEPPAGETAGSNPPPLPKAVDRVLKQLEEAGVVLPESLRALASMARGDEGSGTQGQSSVSAAQAVVDVTPVEARTRVFDEASAATVTIGERPETVVVAVPELPRRGASPFGGTRADRWVPNAEPTRVAPAVARSEPNEGSTVRAAGVAPDDGGLGPAVAAVTREASDAMQATTGSASVPVGGRLPALSSVDAAVQALLGALERTVEASDAPQALQGGGAARVPTQALPEQFRVARVASELARQVGQVLAPTAGISVSPTQWLSALRTQFATGATLDGTAPAVDSPRPTGVVRAVPAEVVVAEADLPPTSAHGVSVWAEPTVSAVRPAAGIVPSAGANPAWSSEGEEAGTVSQAPVAAVVASKTDPVPVTAGATASGWVARQEPSLAPPATVRASDVPPVIRVGTVEFVTGAPVGPVPAPVAAEDPSAVVARVVRAAVSGRPKAQASVRVAGTVASGRGAGVQATAAPASAETVSGTRADATLPVQPAGAMQVGTPRSTIASGSEARVEPGASAAGVDRVELLQQIHDAVSRMRLSRRGGEVSLRLKPEHLGEMRVAVSVSDGIVRARIVTESPAVRAALETDVAALRRSLSDSGLVVDSIQVSVGGDGASRFLPQRDRSFYSEVYRSFEPRASSALEAVAPAVGLLAVASAAAGATSLSVLV